MKIEGSFKPGTPPAAESKARPAPAPAADAGAATQKVALSPLSTTLQRAEAAIAKEPVVDRARVDEIRQAISEGRFKVDAERIADGLIDSVRQMLDGQQPRS